MRKFGFIAVEGPHDVEFVAALLRPFGLKRVRQLSNLDPTFRELVPRTYPQNDDLLRRHPVPLFLQNETLGIAVQQAGGDSQLVRLVADTKAIWDFNCVDFVGFVLDSDSNVSPTRRYANLRAECLVDGFMLPELPGTVGTGVPRLGAYVLPDVATSGTLEDILLECGASAYPAVTESAKTHVELAINDKSLSPTDRSDIEDPAGQKKAIVSAIASVLRPGKAIQVSLQDNDWFKGRQLDLPRVRTAQEFFATLLDIASGDVE